MFKNIALATVMLIATNSMLLCSKISVQGGSFACWNEISSQIKNFEHIISSGLGQQVAADDLQIKIEILKQNIFFDDAPVYLIEMVKSEEIPELIESINGELVYAGPYELSESKGHCIFMVDHDNIFIIFYKIAATTKTKQALLEYFRKEHHAKRIFIAAYPQAHSMLMTAYSNLLTDLGFAPIDNQPGNNIIHEFVMLDLEKDLPAHAAPAPIEITAELMQTLDTFWNEYCQKK